MMLVSCTCPFDARFPWDCLGCPVCGEKAEAEAEAEHTAELAAESAWLRAAEYDPRMDDPREW